MKHKILIISLFTSLCFFSCKTQQVNTTTNLPKIANYTKGELTIKIAPFGLGKEITVGKVVSNGTIQFNWQDIDVNTIEGSEYFMEPLQRVAGMSFCNTKEIMANTKTVKAIAIKNLFLYKNGQQVGSLFPATKKEIEDNNGLNRSSSLVLGSHLTWFYSDGEGEFKATCTVNMEYDNSYNFKEVTTYDIQLKKGWNIIRTTLVEKEDWKNENDKGSLPKTMSKTSITKIPENINWYVKYWGE